MGADLPDRLRLERGVYACWHEHLFPLACLLAHQELTTLASHDRDGEIVNRVLRRLGYTVVRGSSSRGGATAYRHLRRARARGRGVILTVDGPRGPRRSLKPGIVRLAEHSSGEVHAVAVAASKGIRLNSWDRFLVPAPGATVFFHKEPVAVRSEPLKDEWGREGATHEARGSRVSAADIAAALGRGGRRLRGGGAWCRSHRAPTPVTTRNGRTKALD